MIQDIKQEKLKLKNFSTKVIEAWGQTMKNTNALDIRGSDNQQLILSMKSA